MTVATYTAFFEALKAAAQANGVSASRVYEGVAPTGATVPYIVYNEAGDTGPYARVYGGSFVEDDVYAVNPVANSRLAAITLREALKEWFRTHAVGVTLQCLVEQNIPSPQEVTDTARFVRGFYVRVTYVGGQA